MIGSRMRLATVSVALGIACGASSLWAQNQNRSSGGSSTASQPRSGIFRSFFQNTIGRIGGNSAESDGGGQEAPPQTTNKPRTMPKAPKNTDFNDDSNVDSSNSANNQFGNNGNSGFNNSSNNGFKRSPNVMVPRSTFPRPGPTQSPSANNSSSTAGNNSLVSIARNVCLCHPQARREMLAALNDRSENTRLSAVQALVETATHQCPHCGRSPVDDDVVAQVLADIAYGKDADGRWLEPSENVRYTAREAMRYSHHAVGETAGVAPDPRKVPSMTRPPAGSFIADDDLGGQRRDVRPTPMQNSKNRGTFGPNSTMTSRGNSNTVQINDDPVDPPRPQNLSPRGSTNVAVPGRGSDPQPSRGFTTVDDNPPSVPDPSETLPQSNSSRRTPSSSRSTMTTPNDEPPAAIPTPKNASVIIEDAPPPAPPVTNNTVTNKFVNEPQPSSDTELKSTDSGRVSSRRAKRPTPAVEAAPVQTPDAAPAVLPSAPALTPTAPVLSTPAATTPASAAPAAIAPAMVSPPPVPVSQPVLKPQAAVEPKVDAPPAALIPQPEPTPAAPSPTESNAPTEAAPRAALPLKPAPIRSIGPTGSGASASATEPTLAPPPGAKTGEPTLAPPPPGGPQLGPAAKKTIRTSDSPVIRSSFDVTPARGSRISAYDEAPRMPEGVSTLQIK